MKILPSIVSGLCLLVTASIVLAADVPMLSDDIVLSAVLPDALKTIDLGSLYSGQVARRTVMVKNQSGRSVLVNARTSCPCLTIEVAQPALRSGESTTLVIAADTQVQNGTGGNAGLSFILSDDLAKDKVLLKGKVVAKIAPTVVASATTVSWRLAFGPFAPQSVTFENKTDWPITLDHALSTADGRQYMKISPETATLQPKSKVAISFLPTDDCRRYGFVRSKEEFVLRVGDPKAGLSEWKLYVPVDVLPQAPLIAAPGAIMVDRKNDFKDGSVTQGLKLMATRSSSPVVDDVTCANKLIRLTHIRDEEWQVRIDEPNQAFIDELIVKYTIDNRKVTLAIPVFVYP